MFLAFFPFGRLSSVLLELVLFVFSLYAYPQAGFGDKNIRKWSENSWQQRWKWKWQRQWNGYGGQQTEKSQTTAGA